jgi:hypothetical protein
LTDEFQAYGRGPERAHTIILKAGGDTAQELAWELRSLADRIERGELTVGAGGGPSAGSTYSYRVAPEQTHQKYFQEIDAWLERERQETESSDVDES